MSQMSHCVPCFPAIAGMEEILAQELYGFVNKLDCVVQKQPHGQGVAMSQTRHRVPCFPAVAGMEEILAIVLHCLRSQQAPLRSQQAPFRSQQASHRVPCFPAIAGMEETLAKPKFWSE